MVLSRRLHLGAVFRRRLSRLQLLLLLVVSLLHLLRFLLMPLFRLLRSRLVGFFLLQSLIFALLFLFQFLSLLFLLSLELFLLLLDLLIALRVAGVRRCLTFEWRQIARVDHVWLVVVSLLAILPALTIFGLLRISLWARIL